MKFRATVSRRRVGQAAFSLLEILMVISILTVLTALILPTLKTAKEMSKRAACASNMRQIGLAFRMYQSDHRGLYPNPWIDNQANWQGYLCGSLPVQSGMPGIIGPNQYLPGTFLGFCNDFTGTDDRGNIGNNNTGSNNIGNNNSGNNNIGNSNSGNHNTGNHNSGNNNVGNNNSGDYNNGSNQSGNGSGGNANGNPAPNPFVARLLGKILCPTICQTYNIPMDGAHKYWGYTYNYTRTGISYAASSWPWSKAQYQNMDLDAVYPKSGISAVMTCGNGPSFNSDSDWNAFTVTDPTDWPVAKIHADSVNTLFMDGHVEGMNVASTAGQRKFNFVWYNGIPTTLPNPW